MMLANHSVLKDICSHPALICWIFFFAMSKLFFFFYQTSSQKLFFLACSFTIHVQRSGVLLYNHISRSFVTALSQHAMCLTPKRSLLFLVMCKEESWSTHFAKTKTQWGEQNRIYFCNCECNHRQCLFACSRLFLHKMQEWINYNETQLLPICFLLYQMWPQSCERVFRHF